MSYQTVWIDPEYALLQNAAPWMFPKPNEVPVLSKLQKMLRRPGQKSSPEGSATISLEGKPLQGCDGLQATRQFLAQ